MRFFCSDGKPLRRSGKRVVCNKSAVTLLVLADKARQLLRGLKEDGFCHNGIM